MSNSLPAAVDGILNLNKPMGTTSMDMVRWAKRLTRVRRVGHGGTLDPVAGGVLPICFGQATRVMEYLISGSKVYRARVRMGVTTDTYDSLGKVTEEADPSQITREQVVEKLPSLTGTISQQPPMYSALKREGKRLYDLARAGVEVERAPRQVKVHRLELVEWEPPFLTLEAECGRGVYMRSLAHDLGKALGVGAHIHSLVRLRTGPFRLEDAVSPDEFAKAVEEGKWLSLLQPPDVILLGVASITVEARAERLLRSGQPVPAGPDIMYASHLERRRAYSPDGRFVGVVRLNKAQGIWQPEKVFQIAHPSMYSPRLAGR
ncbi:MAG: tRNA pseudouridine(55) synthase TruB [Chloroflexi bacterium]|nr:tRNA pseudouridine(55) synthase TruB [Chloroflexota bacterium]